EQLRNIPASWRSESVDTATFGRMAWFIRRCSVVRPFTHRSVLVSGTGAAAGDSVARVPAGWALVPGEVARARLAGRVAGGGAGGAGTEGGTARGPALAP